MDLQHHTALSTPSPRDQYAALKALVRTLRITELALAEKLAEVERTKAYLELASDMRGYMDGLDLARGKGGDLLRIGRKLTELPVLRAAMAEQRVSWTAAREVVKIATPETEAGWVARAEDWTGRQLRAAVLSAGPGEDAPDREDRPANPPVVYRFELSAEDAEQVAKALAMVRLAAPDEAGELTDGEALLHMAEMVLAGPSEAHAVPAERIRKVIRVCATCEHTELAGTRPDETVNVSSQTRAIADCDSEVVDLRPGADGRMHHTVTPRIRRIVFDRDDYRCRIPGCTNRWHIDVHHVVHRADGGDHSVDNLHLACSGCHARIHRGQLHVESDGHGGFCFDWSPNWIDTATNSTLIGGAL